MDLLLRFATTGDGVRICYSVTGSGPPIVFVRGWFSHLELIWEASDARGYLGALARRGRLVTFDCRGNGLSDRRPDTITIDALVADLEAVVEDLSLTGFVLYGMGYGGPVAIEYAARHADRVAALVLFGTRARPEGVDYEPFIKAIEEVPGGFVLAAWNSSRDDPSTLSRGVDFLRQACDKDLIRPFYKLTETFDVRESCERITAPVLVMHPRKSSVPFALAREMAASIPGARFVALEGADYNPWRAEPERSLALVDDFLAELGLLEARPRPVVAAEAPYVFRCEGDYWTLAYDGTAVRVRDALGMRYLAALLAQPGRELHVAQLTGSAGTREAAHAGNLLDAESRRNYQRRIEELRDEIEDAKRFEDAGRAERAQDELDALTSQLAAAFGLGGRARRASDTVERMRKAITNRVRDSMRRISGVHPALGSHLHGAVRTGTFCCYDPDEAPAWSL